MLASSCVLRERALCFVYDEEVQKVEENHKRIPRVEMSDNIVIRGVKFWVNKERRLMGEVHLPMGEGLEVRGKFTMRGAGATAADDVELVQLAESDDFFIAKTKYKIQVCDYSLKEVREKYLKTSKEKEEPHFEIQIDVEVSKGKKELMGPGASKDRLVKDVSRLLEDKGSSDMVIECQGEMVPCHRAVLVARSATFAGGLGNEFVEKKEGKWKAEQFSLGAVRDMLFFIYTGRSFLGVEVIFFFFLPWGSLKKNH